MREGGLARRVGARIAFYRRNRPDGLLSQERLAERLGVSLSTLRKIEQGERAANLGTLKKLCQVMGIGVHEVICGVGVDSALASAAAPFVRFVQRRHVSAKDADALAMLLEGFWERMVHA